MNMVHWKMWRRMGPQMDRWLVNDEIKHLSQKDASLVVVQVS